MDQKLIDKLNKRKEEGTLRSLSLFDGMIDFQSNDYLGLSYVEFDQEKTKFGSTGSRLISGNSNPAEKLEKMAADFFRSPASLLFNSGYDANIGFFSSVPQRGDTVIFDESIHASVRDGIRLSFSDSFSFKHNDLSDLEKKLVLTKGTKYVAVESLYSMSGELSPLKEINELCRKYNAFLIVDEAHAGGVFGKDGEGYCCELGIEKEVFARLITFGKAFGSHGAVFLVSEDLKQYLVNFARSFIYTTALPPDNLLRIIKILSSDLHDKRVVLQKNIELFRSQMTSFEIVSNAHSPIQIIRFDSRNILKSVADKCLEKGFAVKAVFHPTVKASEECLRINLNAIQKSEDILALAELIKST